MLYLRALRRGKGAGIEIIYRHIEGVHSHPRTATRSEDGIRDTDELGPGGTARGFTPGTQVRPLDRASNRIATGPGNTRGRLRQAALKVPPVMLRKKIVPSLIAWQTYPVMLPATPSKLSAGTTAPTRLWRQPHHSTGRTPPYQRESPRHSTRQSRGLRRHRRGHSPPLSSRSAQE